MRVHLVLLSIVAILIGAAPVHGADALLAPDTSQPASQPAGAAEPILPPLPATTQPTLTTQPSVVVRSFRFTGNAHIPADELRAVVKPYLDRPLTIEDLEEARVAVTKHLVGKGFINSGAVLPDQNVDEGVVTFQIVEGKLTDIHLSGNKHLRGSYITSRLQRSVAPPPMNILSLKDELEELRQDPNLKSIQAELRPGAVPGESILDVQVQEANPYTLALVYSNRRPPSVGSTAIDLIAADRDLTGNGDALLVRYDVLNGAPGDMAYAGLTDYSIDYTIPVSPSDTTINFDFTRTDSNVGETPFQDLDIDSRLNSYSLTIRQPIYRRPIPVAPTATTPGKPAMEIALFATATIRDETTTLLGEPFQFSPGAYNGKSRVVALRLGQELSTRSFEDALSIRSIFSFGLPILSATRNSGDIPDSQFISWLGQAQYIHRLPGLKVLPDDTQLVVRSAVQFSNSPLLTTEQFAIGGFDTVRGYRENTLVVDEGIAGSVELRIPVLQTGTGDNILSVVPFVDAGYGANLGANVTGGATNGAGLSSVGVGVVYTPNTHMTAQLFYGYQLMNQTKTHQDLQDIGLHFSVTLSAF